MKLSEMTLEQLQAERARLQTDVTVSPDFRTGMIAKLDAEMQRRDLSARKK